MKINHEQLTQHLNKELKPIYFLSSDEPLLIDEIKQLIKCKALSLDYTQYQILTAENKFNWQSLLDEANLLSLFGNKKIIELRLPSAKPGDSGSKVLRHYCENPPKDTILIIISGKIDGATQNSKWLQAIDAVGVVIQIWPIDRQQLPRWIAARLKSVNLQTTAEGLALIAEHTQGNLLATAQTIEKLHLVYTSGPISVEQIAEMISDCARFDIFQLADMALQGNTAETIRIFTGLKNEGGEAILILWVLAREIRQLIPMCNDKGSGMAIPAILQKYKIWQKRKPILQAALQRYSSKELQQLLQQASRIDNMIKGIVIGNHWDELLQLACAISGKPLFMRLTI